MRKVICVIISHFAVLCTGKEGSTSLINPLGNDETLEGNRKHINLDDIERIEKTKIGRKIFYGTGSTTKQSNEGEEESLRFTKGNNEEVEYDADIDSLQVDESTRLGRKIYRESDELDKENIENPRLGRGKIMTPDSSTSKILSDGQEKINENTDESSNQVTSESTSIGRHIYHENLPPPEPLDNEDIGHPRLAKGKVMTLKDGESKALSSDQKKINDNTEISSNQTTSESTSIGRKIFHENLPPPESKVVEGTDESEIEP